jgi:hypothetical protein
MGGLLLFIAAALAAAVSGRILVMAIGQIASTIVADHGIWLSGAGAFVALLLAALVGLIALALIDR